MLRLGMGDSSLVWFRRWVGLTGDRRNRQRRDPHAALARLGFTSTGTPAYRRPRRDRPFVRENFDSIVAGYRAGTALAELAAERATSVAAIVSQLRAAGIPSRRRERRARALVELPHLVAAGADLDELALRFHVCRETVRAWLRVAGVEPPRRPPLRLSIPEELVARYLAGERARTLAAELGISERAFRGRLERFGVRRPPRPEPACPRCGGPVSSRHAKSCRTCRQHPKPATRECALDGCDVVFTPPTNKPKRFCSPEHWYDSCRGAVPKQFARAAV